MFSEDLAVKIGVEKATLMSNLHYWLDWSKANHKNMHDGFFWTYNSSTAFAKLFPYWSSKKIANMLRSLEDDGYLLSGSFNKAGYDRTKWYTTPNYLIVRNGTMDSPELDNGLSEMGQPIPYIKPVNKPVSKHIDRFDEFWDLYAKKTGRPKCESKFKKLKDEEIEKIFLALPAYVVSTPEKKYRKDPMTWLNGQHWNDEIINNVNTVTKVDHTFGHNDYDETI